MIQWLSGGVVVVLAKAENILLEAFVEGVEDGVGRSQCEETMGGEVNLGVRKGVFILLVVQP